MQKIFTLVLTTIFFLNTIKSIDGRKIHKKDPNWFWKHCTKQHLCMEGEGDCDTDLECHGDLKCGDDNCNGHLHKNADCCFQPARVPTCTYLGPSRDAIIHLSHTARKYPLLGYVLVVGCSSLIMGNR